MNWLAWFAVGILIGGMIAVLAMALVIGGGNND